MERLRRFTIWGLMAGLLAVAWPAPADVAPAIGVTDSGPQVSPSTYGQCVAGHPIRTQTITLDSGKIRYAFASYGCIDPSHGEERPNAEGNFGMPQPTAANWYHSGFLRVLINGKDACRYRVSDMRVLESGGRGSFQIVWEHPDAQVGLRIAMLPGSNHVLASLTWKPRPGVTLKTVTVELRCYPSFFTSARHRAGARHCQTPRTDQAQPTTLNLVPGQDTYLYYYDTTFDVAKGEGDGPCAALVPPAGLLGGTVNIGDYAEITKLDYKPESGGARLGFYDFTGSTNAVAESYMKAQGGTDLAELLVLDFRPEVVQKLDVAKLNAEAKGLLADAADDGKTLAPKVDELLAKVAALKAKMDAGDWQAEAELSSLLDSSRDLFWRLRIFALINNPN